MIEEHAYILTVSEQEALVEIKRQSSCQSCASQSSCGTSSLSQLFGKRPSQFTLNLKEVKNSHVLHQGDEVLIGLDESGYLKASMLIYIWPIVFMLLLAIFAEIFIGLSDTYVLLFSLFGLWVGFKFAHFKAHHQTQLLTPHLIRKL